VLNILYFLYIVFFMLLFFTPDFTWAYTEFVYLIIPIAFVPVKVTYNYSGNIFPKINISVSMSNSYETLSNIRSIIFSSALIFGLAVVISSTIQPSFSLSWFWSLAKYLITITIFMLITARLALHKPKFYERFFFLLSIIGSLNSVINIISHYYYNYDSDVFPMIRLMPTFGAVPDHWPTTAAMTYATCFVSSVSLILMDIQITKKLISVIAAIILLYGLLLTQSRGPLVGTMVALLISTLILFRLTHHRFGVIVFCVFALATMIMVPKIGVFALQRGDGSRPEIWSRFIKLALDRPLIGYGERLQFLVELDGGNMLGHAHNIFISSLIRGGIFSLFALILSYTLSVIKCIELITRFNNPLPLALVILIIIAGSVDFDQIIFMSDWQWVSFWLPIGCAIASELQVNQKKRHPTYH
jgi:hypothetical protein